LPCEAFRELIREITEFYIVQRRREKRNASGDTAYYVDEGLLHKTKSLFEEPSEDEVGMSWWNKRTIVKGRGKHGKVYRRE